MKVVKRQTNSRNCIICGLDNPLGVKAPFYELEDGRLYTRFQFKPEHQSYPGRVHGGMITAMLDELAGRVYWIVDPNMYAVTTSIDVKFRKPVPYNTILQGVGKIIVNTSRAYEAVAEIRTMDGVVLATADIKYMKITGDKVTDANIAEEMCYDIPDDLKDVEV